MTPIGYMDWIRLDSENLTYVQHCVVLSHTTHR